MANNFVQWTCTCHIHTCTCTSIQMVLAHAQCHICNVYLDRHETILVHVMAITDTIPQATEADAVLAISLYEESLASLLGTSKLNNKMSTLFHTSHYALTGYSVLGIAPAPHFTNDDISQYIGKKVSELI